MLKALNTSMTSAARALIDRADTGTILSGSPNVFIDGYPAARRGDPIAPHGYSPSPHDSAVIATGSPNVFVNGIPLARLGDPATCGDVINPCSNDVFVNGNQVNTNFGSSLPFQTRIGSGDHVVDRENIGPPI